MVDKPVLKTGKANQELDNIEEQFNAQTEAIKAAASEPINAKKAEEVEPQTQLSAKELQKAKEIVLKPVRSISVRDKFNEKYREDYNWDKEYVRFVAEHREMVGCAIEKWTRPYAGMPAEYWEVPTNKPVWGPRYLQREINACEYVKRTMENSIIDAHAEGAVRGAMVVDHVVNRLSARIVEDKPDARSRFRR